MNTRPTQTVGGVRTAYYWAACNRPNCDWYVTRIPSKAGAERLARRHEQISHPRRDAA